LSARVSTRHHLDHPPFSLLEGLEAIQTARDEPLGSAQRPGRTQEAIRILEGRRRAHSTASDGFADRQIAALRFTFLAHADSVSRILA
jgi:hypothetical protein